MSNTVTPLSAPAWPMQSQPRRIALAGDWHGNLAYARRAIAQVQYAGGEGIVHLGDFGVWPGTGGRLYLKGVNDALSQHGLWLGVVDGNHDDHWQLNSLPVAEDGTRQLHEHIWWLPRGHRWQWHERTWLALGGAVSLDRSVRILGRSWWPDETQTSAQLTRVIMDGHADVVVAHDCPDNVDIPDLLPASRWEPHAFSDALAHRAALREVMEVVQPGRYFHGHFHVAYIRQVTFGGRPCVVEGLGCDEDPLEFSLRMLDLTQL